MTPWGPRPPEAAGGGQDRPLPRGAGREHGALLSGANGVVSPHSQPFSAKLQETADPDKRQMLERLQRAVAQAAEPVEGALRAGLAGQELDGRVQVRLRCVRGLAPPVKAAPSGGAGGRLSGLFRPPRGLCPLLVAAPPGEHERRRRGSPLGVSAVCWA